MSHILARQGGFQVRVIAIEPKDESFDYGPIVVGRIQQGGDDEYLRAIDHIDRINPDVICLQHEYGLWGQWDEELISDHAVRFLETVRKNWPGMGVVSTLHTVRPSPSPLEYDVIRGIVGLSSVSTVMADTGVKILRDGYGIISDTIVHLPLGVSAGDDRSRASCKRQLDLQGRTVISTLGLLDPRKGVEYAIRAMRTPWRRHPAHIGGYLSDSGVHAIASLHALGGPISQIHALTTSFCPDELGPIDTLLLNLAFASGLIGHVAFSVGAPEQESRALLLYGTEGRLALTPSLITVKSSRGERSIPVPPVDPFQAAFKDFHRAIVTGDSPLGTAVAALADLQVIGAALSAASASVVAVSNGVGPGYTWSTHTTH